jgi:hypothetical protein
VGKKLLMMILLLGAAGGGYYYWMIRSSAPPSAPTTAQAPTARKGAPAGPSAPKPSLGHPLPGELVAKEQSFFEADYGFSMVLPVGWRVVSWTEPAPPESGKRRPSYKIRMEDPKSGSLLDFAVYPFTEKSRYAVEEIFISKIEPPVPGFELDIQLDEVVKQGDMRIRRAEMKTRDAQGAVGMMKTYYYLSNDKLYTFSLLGSEQTFASQGQTIAKILDDIRILG